MKPGLVPGVNCSVLELTHITSTGKLLARASYSLSQPQGGQEVQWYHVPRRKRARTIWPRAPVTTHPEVPQRVMCSESGVVHVGGSAVSREGNTDEAGGSWKDLFVKGLNVLPLSPKIKHLSTSTSVTIRVKDTATHPCHPEPTPQNVRNGSVTHRKKCLGSGLLF